MDESGNTDEYKYAVLLWMRIRMRDRDCGKDGPAKNEKDILTNIYVGMKMLQV